MISRFDETRRQLAAVISAAFAAAAAEGLLPTAEAAPFVVEVPGDTANGDFAANAAMVNARTMRMAPQKLAALLTERFDFGSLPVERCEVAGPGFINFYMEQSWFASLTGEVLQKGEAFGRSDYGRGEKVMVEFVSANPTGPMHMGNARGGAIGDGLAEVLSWCGYDVTREFYVNDAGNQIAKFGKSLEARYLQLYLGEDAVEFPEDGYHGEDIKVRAKEFADMHGDKYVNADSEERRQALIDYALPANVEGLERDLHTYRIDYDVWFRESSLYADGSIDEIVKILTDKGLTYEKDGALWYKNAEVLTEMLKAEGKTDKQIEALELKDDVLIRQNGNPTYFAGDIAYHYNKFAKRGFDRVINVWGADHHGHVARLKGAMNALGLDGNKLDVVLMQLVELVRDGKPVRMSKRTGKAITLTDLLEEVPIDAARFFFNMREPNTHLIFDLDLAVEQSSQNPVYYVQYAHARICSILKSLAAEGVAFAGEIPAGVLKEPEELALISCIAAFPGEIKESARLYDPAHITKYAVDIASAFHKFYNACRCRCDDEKLMQARIALCLAAKTTIKNVLTVLNITVPESM